MRLPRSLQSLPLTYFKAQTSYSFARNFFSRVSQRRFELLGENSRPTPHHEIAALPAVARKDVT